MAQLRGPTCRAQLQGAHLIEAQLQGLPDRAQLQGPTFHASIEAGRSQNWQPGADSGADLTLANLRDADLSDAQLPPSQPPRRVRRDGPPNASCPPIAGSTGWRTPRDLQAAGVVLSAGGQLSPG